MPNPFELKWGTACQSCGEHMTEGDMCYYIEGDKTALDEACCQEGCMNYRAEGYIMCEGHLYGFPKPLPEHLANAKAEQEGERTGLCTRS